VETVVEFAEPFLEVPDPIRVDLVARLQEVAESLNALPRSSVVWESVEVSTMLLDVKSWRFEYRVELGGKRIVVQTALFFGR
jgi:hypothetical protein